MKETLDLVQKCIDIEYSRLPPDGVDQAKYLLLDYLGVAARGSLSDSGRAVQRMITRLGKEPRGAVIIGTNLNVSPPNAALANGIAAHSIELDDVVNEASLHPGVTVMSAALSAGHMSGCSGKKLIESIIAGYEATIRLGIALDPAAHYAQGFHPTATCGTLGAAVTAAKILGLSASETVSALGIAGSQAAGSMEFLTDGALTKRFHAGWAANSGLVAALLAREGFTGPKTIIEGKYGFLNAYSPKPDPSRLLKDWGRPFQVLKTSIKPHSCCRYKQGPIDGILRLMAENRLKPEDIESVTLGILNAGFPLVAHPEAQKKAPRSIVDAQFSMPFGAAVAILYGKASLEEYTMEKIHSTEVKAMMQRVHCITVPELEMAFPQKWPAAVTIRTQNGEELKIHIDFPRGDPENPLTRDELIYKFTELMSPVYPAESVGDVIEQSLTLEKADSIEDLLALLIKA